MPTIIKRRPIITQIITMANANRTTQTVASSKNHRAVLRISPAMRRQMERLARSAHSNICRKWRMATDTLLVVNRRQVQPHPHHHRYRLQTATTAWAPVAIHHRRRPRHLHRQLVLPHRRQICILPAANVSMRHRPTHCRVHHNIGPHNEQMALPVHQRWQLHFCQLAQLPLSHHHAKRKPAARRRTTTANRCRPPSVVCSTMTMQPRLVRNMVAAAELLLIWSRPPAACQPPPPVIYSRTIWSYCWMCRPNIHLQQQH